MRNSQLYLAILYDVLLQGVEYGIEAQLHESSNQKVLIIEVSSNII